MLLWPEQVFNQLMDKIMDREYIDRPDVEVNAVHDEPIVIRKDPHIVFPPEFVGAYKIHSFSANEKQVDGSHYKNKAIQPWDYISSNNFGFLEGSVIKYVSRYKEKNGVRDLEKAKHFLEKLIEVNSK